LARKFNKDRSFQTLHQYIFCV